MSMKPNILLIEIRDGRVIKSVYEIDVAMKSELRVFRKRSCIYAIKNIAHIEFSIHR